ncbi:class I SAM-dependent methyltransferase [Deinococcus humi]|uniref:SAM-dependent methyltransferase n=1 Tax=Deinococcus humi TaxID=662880 RepID=A0A7W8NEV6_9DEIO|nr:class I SAM-dependent methyltransferase [Deinococcus humi]MBB5363736.1 SAM-dependent methyltransferase [Deinococcus humi]GGO29556.1 methyltransferase [Deinococcus humi]
MITSTPPQPDPNEAATYWETRYQTQPKPWTGRPNAIMARWSETLPTDTALDLGCSEGNSAVWLAQRGWQVTGVDISATALSRAAQHAANAGVTARTAFQQHDLAATFPTGQFSFVYALYLQSPVAFPRDEVLRKAAAAVQPGGVLLVVEHASAPSWAPQVRQFPTAQEALDTINLELSQWDLLFLGSPERAVTEAKGPNGEIGVITDNIIALRRKP